MPNSHERRIARRAAEREQRHQQARAERAQNRRDSSIPIAQLMRSDFTNTKGSIKRTKQLKVTARSHDGTESGWALSPSITSMAVSHGEAGTLLDARWDR